MRTLLNEAFLRDLKAYLRRAEHVEAIPPKTPEALLNLLDELQN
jgi:hypothetical protein